MSLNKEECNEMIIFFETELFEYQEDNSVTGEEFNEMCDKYNSMLKQLRDEHFAPEHTVNFKCFHLLADSTLKQWGKEALIDYIHTLYHNWESTDIGYNSVMDYANKLRDELDNNPPLTFEELHEDMWVWDDEYKAWRQIHTTYNLNLHDVIEFKDGQYSALARKCFFEAGRFYRKQVE